MPVIQQNLAIKKNYTASPHLYAYYFYGFLKVIMSRPQVKCATFFFLLCKTDYVLLARNENSTLKVNIIGS